MTCLDFLNRPINPKSSSLPFDRRVSDLLEAGIVSSGIGSNPGMLIAPNPDEWLLLDDDVLLTEIMECGRLLPFFRCSIEETAIEFRDLGTEMKTLLINGLSLTL